MRLSPMCAQNALPFCTRQMAQVARGRISMRQVGPQLGDFLVRPAE